MSTAIIYLRVSSEQQSQNYSLETQRAACRAYAAQRGLEIVAEIEDHETGTKFDRRGFAEVRKMLTEGKARALIVYTQDRLHRSLIHTLLSRNEIRSLGVQLHYANRGPAATDPDGQMIENLEAVIAEAERLRIMERTARGRAGKIASGKILGHGTAPFGYTFVGQRRERELVINEDEAAVVRLVFRWYTEGDGTGPPLSSRQISDKLTAQRIPTWADRREATHGKKQAYGHWNDVVIIRLLRKAVYAGNYEYWMSYADGHKRTIPREERRSAAVPAIVSRETWELAQRRLDAGRSQSKRRGTAFYLIGRRFRCSCGYAMVGSRKGHENTDTAYTCAGKRSRPPCSTPSYHGARTDTAVWAWIASLIRDYDRIIASDTRRAAQPAPPDDAQATIAQQIVATQAQLDELATLRVTKRIQAASYDKLFGELSATLRRLEADRATLDQRSQDTDRAALLTDRATAVVAAIREELETLPSEMRRMVVDLLEVRATVALDGARRGLVLESWLTPEPVTIWLDAAPGPYYNV